MPMLALVTFTLSWGAGQAFGQPIAGKDPNSIRELRERREKQRVSNEERQAAAKRLAAAKAEAAKNPRPQAYTTVQGGIPDYVGIANWANSPMIRKFVDTLPLVGAANANNVDQDPATPGVQGQYISVANPDKLTYPGSDYYEIELREFTGKFHSDLPPTRLRGYVQVNNGTNTAGTTNDVAPSPIRYLGPTIVAQKDRPVRVKFTNRLPTGVGGDLFLPVDTSVMGSGIGPVQEKALTADRVGGAGATVEVQTDAPHNLVVGQRVVFVGFVPLQYNGVFTVLAAGLTADTFQVKLASDPGGPATTLGNVGEVVTQNRATLHLHGGRTPWISDGTPHQWTTPVGEDTAYPKGVSIQNINVPDMPDPGEGSITFFYTNQQSARLLFYHDHAWGITRLNVYVGQVAGYLITDATEKDLVTRNILPADLIPLIIQDKSFVDPATVLTTDPTWNWGTGTPNPTTGFRPPVAGDLWYPHVYVPAQNPYDVSGANAFGRWHYGPWFFPPTTDIAFPPLPNPYYDPVNAPWEPSEMPGTPNPSMPGESFFDIAVVNGTAYPTVTVDPRTYRFRILNGANDRFFNLHLYVASNIVDSLALTSGGSGYSDDPLVTITPAAGDTTGHGATATATIDEATGAVVAITLDTVGSGYTAAPTVTIAPPTTGTAATATATLYTAATEVGMVPAVPTSGFPALWPKDGRVGGVPDPATRGPKWVQIGTEGGFLPAPAVIPPQPIGWNLNPTTFDFGNVYDHSLLVAPAERADVLVDFSAFAGKTLILFNDAPAAFPALDDRYNYYTGAPDLRDSGGYGRTLPDGSLVGPAAGFSPNIRTMMQIKVAATTPAEAFDLPGTTNDGMGRLQAEFASTATTPGVFARSQAPIVVTQKEYNSAYGKSGVGADTFPTTYPLWGYARIQDWSMQFQTTAGTNLSLDFQSKALHDEMGAAFDEYGRMSGKLGLEMPNVGPFVQNFNLQTFVDPVTEILKAVPAEGVSVADDGTQIWRITHNGVDTHPMHFHLFDVQLLNRVGWDGAIRLPDENERGWKETVRTSPLEDTIVALRPVAPKAPFGFPDSKRPLNPSEPIGSMMGFSQIDPYTGNAPNPPVTNQIVNFGWEYVWHCHILSHEEMDMMRPMKFNVPRGLPEAPVLTVLGPTVATLNWTDGTPFDYTLGTPVATIGDPNNEIGFRIERSDNNGPFTTLTTAPANKTSYTDATINPLVGYKYRVVAFNAAGETPSNTATLGVPIVEVIVDNLDPGASSVGTWTASNNPGVWATNSVYSNTAGSTFSFTAGLSPDATYAVFAWWNAASNRSQAVPYQIRSGTTLLDTVTVNQRLNGSQWYLLGVYKFADLARVTVVQSGGITIADAVRFLPVTLQSLTIAGPLTVDENTTAQYTASANYSGGVTQTVQPQTWSVNVPAASINASGLLTAGAVDADTPATISASYTAYGATVGNTLAITVRNAAPTPIEVIVDNLSAGVSSTGTWIPSTSAGFYGTNSVYSSTGGSTFTFNATLVPGTTYAVYAWWTAATNRSLAVPYQVRDGAALLDTLTVNQRLSGGQWNLLGTYVFTGAASVVVTQSGGITVADAVRFLPVTTPPEIIVDNLSPLTSSTGIWSTTTTPGFWGTNSAYSSIGGSTFKFSPNTTNGTTYAVYAWWTAATNRSTAVPYQIRNGTTLLGTVNVNQRLNGGQWNLLGTYTFTAPASITVVQSGTVTIADAVRLVPQ
ncbi:MAG: multicopper oxidase domain-containing protein [Phycisphaerales bacterium]